MLSLLLSCASAAGVYEVDPDVELDSTIWWPSDYKISTLDLTPTESSTLTWIHEQLVDIWNDMRAGFTFVDDDIVAGNTLLSNLYTLLDGSDSTLSYILQGVGMTNGYLNVTNTKLADLIGTVGIGNSALGRLETLLGITGPTQILNMSGDPGSVSSSMSLSEMLRQGVLGMGALQRDIVSRLKIVGPTQILNMSGDPGSVSSTMSLSEMLRQGVLGLGSLERDVISRLQVVGPTQILNMSGYPGSVSSTMSLSEMLRQGLIGLGSQLRIDTGESVLLPSGVSGSVSGYLGLDNAVSTGFLGLRSLISGSQANNVYQGTSINNENKTSTFSATGLGPMLNTWLGDIQNDLGLLSFVFASPQDLKLKQESEDNMTAVGDSLLSKDNASSVKVSDITDISEASTAIQGFGNTGVTPGQAFAQLGDSNLFRFFSAETAADLDTTTSTYSRDPKTQIVTNYYEESRSEFYKIIAGEGNDG